MAYGSNKTEYTVTNSLIVRDVTSLIEKTANRDLKCKWDHVGLMTGSLDDKVAGVITCLDVTLPVLKEAKLNGCNLVISHHPFLFNPVCSFEEDANLKELVDYALENRITIYSAHTNLDYAEDGVNAQLSKLVKIDNPTWDEEHHHIYGTFNGNFKKLLHTVSINVLNEGCKSICKAPSVPIIFGKNQEAIKKVQSLKVAVSSGAFDGETEYIKAHGIDILVTGEVKHHESIALENENFTTLACGHYLTEHPIARSMAEKISKELLRGEISKKSLEKCKNNSKNDLKILQSQAEKNPFFVD